MNGRPLVVALFAVGVLALGVLVYWARTRPVPPPLPAPVSVVATGKPNIVLISIDAVRPDHLSCYGYAKRTSPRIDRVAEQGVLFEQCRAQAPWTLPSHMSLFTSMLPTHNGVDNLNKTLPADLTTLAQVLREEGYRTAAVVNNGQMRAHWGFNRGFDTWREYEVDTPEGDADQLTDRALEWLREHADKPSPYFLYLHYYDAHDPYDAPPAWRQKFGVTIDGNQARSIAFAHRTPEQNITDPALLDALKSAYDAEIAYMDHELGRLFDALPPDTLILIFSDHGECFEEHGWTLHGATLTDPDIRVALIVKPPASWNIPPKRSKESVMLMDVAPTLLSMAGVRPHPQFRGADLSPILRGQPFPQRMIPMETKAVLEGQYLLGMTAGNLKATYSLFDGAFNLRRLPAEADESLTSDEQKAAEAMYSPLKQWIRGERFWMLHAAGRGDHEVIITSPDSPMAMYIPHGLDPQRDTLDVSADGRTLRWHIYPGASEKRKMLLLQPADPDAALSVEFKHNGQPSPGMVHLGDAAVHPESMPVILDGSLPPSDPLLTPPQNVPEGLHIKRHTDPMQPTRPSHVAPLDEETLRQLRSLGYIQ